MENFKKLEENPYRDFYWNIPETRQGRVNVIGGNSGRFHAPVKVAEMLRDARYGVREVEVVLPDVLRAQFEGFPDVVFLGSTDSGSFKDGEELAVVLNSADFNLLIGDLSKNSITARALSMAIAKTKNPVLMTRDAVDVFAEECTEASLLNENLIIFGSMVQLQKIFRAVYYPKMLLLTQPLLQVTDALHKFTLSYPVTIITFHAGQFLVAKDGEVVAIPFEKAGVPILALWGGELAVRVTALNLFNPNNLLKASVAGLFRE